MATYKHSAARPADTTAYTANDVVLGVLTFRPTAFSREEYITDVRLRIDVTAVNSGMTSFRLYLYKTTPASALADNAAFDLPAGDRVSYIGYIDIGTPTDIGSTLFCQLSQANYKIGQTEGLFGYLVTNGAYTPAASTVYTVEIETVALQ